MRLKYYRTADQIRRDRKKREAKRYRRRRVERILFSPNFWGWIGAVAMGLLLVFLVAAPLFTE